MALQPEEIHKLVSSFHDRAKGQRRQSQGAVALMILVVALAFGVFIYAPKITGSANSPAASLSQDNAVLVQYYHYLAENENSRMIAVLAVRVSVTVTLLFFIQILWSLYRYYTRLAGYYSARADSLLLILSQLHKEDGLPTVSELIQLFSPSLNFGKTPSPPEAAVDLARTLLKSAKVRG
jgi:hypothetical protein